VIGAGSGRDIASTVLLTEGIRKQGKVDLAGFLTPWALHRFNGELEKPINKPTKSEKFIPMKEESLDSYFEPLLPILNRELDLGIDDFFLFSLQYGTETLKRELRKLIAQKQYDLIMAVDVGGDILAGKRDLVDVSTPIVDLTCLEILSDIQTNEKILAVMAPGSDGEIPLERLEEILQELQEKNLVLDIKEINKESEDYQKYVEVNEQINHRTTSTSGTFEFIKKNECKTFFLDLDGMRSERDIGPIQFRNILEAHEKFKRLGAKGTEVEANLQFFLSLNGQ
jgi:hypothetical protein